MAGVEVIISDVDFPEVQEVDLKLIELARTMPGKIVTNDFNLNKVAQLRGVEVLNVNELANSLKPVVLPGEIMKVFILKEGKEYNQGVAYLDDGTMVVVDNARKMISKTIDIVVTSRAADDGRQDDLRALHRGRRGRARGRRRTPMRARASRARCKPSRVEAPSLPLVADGLLSDPRDQRLHDRARRGVDRLEPVRPPRVFRARLRARVVVADSEDDRRPRRRSKGWSGSYPGTTYVFVSNHQSIYDTPVIFASLPYQLRIIAKTSLARFPVLGWHLTRGGHLFVDRRHPDRAGILKRWRALVSEGLSLHHLSRRARAAPDGRVGALQGRQLPARD